MNKQEMSVPVCDAVVDEDGVRNFLAAGIEIEMKPVETVVVAKTLPEGWVLRETENKSDIDVVDKNGGVRASIHTFMRDCDGKYEFVSFCSVWTRYQVRCEREHGSYGKFQTVVFDMKQHRTVFFTGISDIHKGSDSARKWLSEHHPMWCDKQAYWEDNEE